MASFSLLATSVSNALSSSHSLLAWGPTSSLSHLSISRSGESLVHCSPDVPQGSVLGSLSLSPFPPQKTFPCSRADSERVLSFQTATWAKCRALEESCWPLQGGYYRKSHTKVFQTDSFREVELTKSNKEIERWEDAMDVILTRYIMSLKNYDFYRPAIFLSVMGAYFYIVKLYNFISCR